jgi:hypothetical protein
MLIEIWCLILFIIQLGTTAIIIIIIIVVVVVVVIFVPTLIKDSLFQELWRLLSKVQCFVTKRPS